MLWVCSTGKVFTHSCHLALPRLNPLQTEEPKWRKFWSADALRGIQVWANSPCWNASRPDRLILHLLQEVTWGSGWWIQRSGPSCLLSLIMPLVPSGLVLTHGTSPKAEPPGPLPTTQGTHPQASSPVTDWACPYPYTPKVWAGTVTWKKADVHTFNSFQAPGFTPTAMAQEVFNPWTSELKETITSTPLS